MLLVAEEKERFAELQLAFERRPHNRNEDWLKELRQEALAEFDRLGFPGSRSEDWKFTTVAPLLEIPFALPEPTANSLALRGRIDSLTLPAAIRLVFINGIWSAELSDLSPKPSALIIANLRSLKENDLLAVKPILAQLADGKEQIFTALNTAFLDDAAVVVIPRGVRVDQPIQVFFIAVAGDQPMQVSPRTLIVAESNSQARVVEHYLSMGDDAYFTNAVTEIALDANTILDHCKLQEESPAAFHIASTQVRQERTSTLHSTYVSLGGRLVRNEARVQFAGEGSEATLDGLYLASGRQHVDNFTVIDHAKPHCTSHELYKGILRDRAHGVFNGKIFVRQDAQKTDAKQTNKVLLLSEEATINTKPQLEIFADDVKCTHGATVGQLDAESVFYLRSRGIGVEEARSLLTQAFANDIVDRVRVADFRELIQRRLADRDLTKGHFS